MRPNLKDKVKVKDILEVRPKYRGAYGRSVEVLEVITGSHDADYLPWFNIMTTNGVEHRGLSHTHFYGRRRMK